MRLRRWTLIAVGTVAAIGVVAALFIVLAGWGFVGNRWRA